MEEKTKTGRQAIEGLEPARLWRAFFELSQIPRCSGNEKGALEFLKSFAQKNSLTWQQDNTGNLLIRKSAATGRQTDQGVVLQAHIDMVGEQNQSGTHDFATQGLTLRRSGDWLSAQDTTLGADNGLGAAVILALLSEDQAEHGPLEGLFTISEEIGLIGAAGLDPELLRGRYLINLDSEEEKVICVGCAGGANTKAVLSYQSEPTDSKDNFLRLKISGLAGGHSGTEINRNLGNALKIGSFCLAQLAEIGDLRLLRAVGGNKSNAIPREFEALFAWRKTDLEVGRERLASVGQKFLQELRQTDPDLRVDLEVADFAGLTRTLTLADSRRLISLLQALPHGVLGMDSDLPESVAVSSNLASIRLDANHSGTDKQALIVCSQRAADNFALDRLTARIASIIELAGGRADTYSRYPGWRPDPRSELLKIAAAAYQKIYNRKPLVEAVHAGLECGVIGSLYPKMQMVSLGMDIEKAHTPQERASVASARRVYGFVKEILRQLK